MQRCNGFRQVLTSETTRKFQGIFPWQSSDKCFSSPTDETKNAQLGLDCPLSIVSSALCLLPMVVSSIHRHRSTVHSTTSANSVSLPSFWRAGVFVLVAVAPRVWDRNRKVVLHGPRCDSGTANPALLVLAAEEPLPFRHILASNAPVLSLMSQS